jgi:hypothetical protein
MPSRLALYSAVGRDITRYEVDVDGATLIRRETIRTLANVQYAWPHPSRRYLYVATSNRGPGLKADSNHVSAFRIDPTTGALSVPGAYRDEHSIDRGRQGRRNDAARQRERRRLSFTAAFVADARGLRLDREDRLSTAQAIDCWAPAGVDPARGDIAYYAPWGNLAIFYKDAGYAKGLVKLGHVDWSLDVLKGRGPLKVTIESAVK